MDDEEYKFEVGDSVTLIEDCYKYVTFGVVYKIISIERHWAGYYFDELDIGIENRKYMAATFKLAD